MDELDELSIFEMFRMEVEEQVGPMEARLLALPRGATAEDLRSLMRAAHSLKGAARIVGMTPVVALTHAMEDRFVTAQGGLAVQADELTVLLRGVDVLRSIGSLTEDAMPAWIAAQEGAVAGLVGQLGGGVAEGPVAVLDRPAEVVPHGSETNLRITTLRFDRVVALSSESVVRAHALEHLSESIVQVRAKLDRMIPQLAEGAVQVEEVSAVRAQVTVLLDAMHTAAHAYAQNAGELHREVMLAKMRPFSDVVPGLQRLVHETAAELGKSVAFTVEGGRAEVDRDILERLRAPLEHLLRNALDHGVETPAERALRGKSPQAAVVLKASHENGRFVVLLSDDGAGIVLDDVRARAVAKGLVLAAVAAELQRDEVLEFLFLPGFSTRTEVSEVSGRGYGLDIVQTMVQAAGGSVQVSSEAGVGTEFKVTLPVSRSLLRVMLVEVDGQVYCFPLARLARVAAVDVRYDGDTAVAEEDGQSWPVMQLANALHDAQERVMAGPATVLFFLRENGREAKIAFAVDRLVGETTVAVRALDARLGKLPGIAAVTLTAENVPMLIVAPDDVLRFAEQKRERRLAEGAARGSVLVVDDSPTVRQMLRRTLLRERYRVAVAEHGGSAWNLLQVEEFDLLVSDVDMPEMNGIELVERVRAKARLQHLPVILLSYKGREEDRRRGLEAGADAYISKGEFDERAFLRMVEDLIGPAEMRA